MLYVQLIGNIYMIYDIGVYDYRLQCIKKIFFHSNVCDYNLTLKTDGHCKDFNSV